MTTHASADVHSKTARTHGRTRTRAQRENTTADSEDQRKKLWRREEIEQHWRDTRHGVSRLLTEYHRVEEGAMMHSGFPRNFFFSLSLSLWHSADVDDAASSCLRSRRNTFARGEV